MRTAIRAILVALTTASAARAAGHPLFGETNAVVHFSSWSISSITEPRVREAFIAAVKAASTAEGLARATIEHPSDGSILPPDMAAPTLTVSPKEDTKETWAWLIKDCDRRTLPLTDEVVQMLADHQSGQPEKHPYVFVLPARYAHIQDQLRAKGKWRYSDSRQKVIPKFNKAFGKILVRAGFHDLRRTALSNWLAKGLSEFEVMKLAGHSNFSTTHRFYLRVRADMIDRARKASTRATSPNLARIWHAPLR